MYREIKKIGQIAFMEIHFIQVQLFTLPERASSHVRQLCRLTHPKP